MENTGQSDRLFEVCRLYEFMNGSRVSIPMGHFLDKADAEQALVALGAQLKAWSADEKMRLCLGAIGISKIDHVVLQLSAPQSRIIRPNPALIVPRLS